jgi:hypothetical protein
MINVWKSICACVTTKKELKWSRRSERTVYIIGSGDDDSVAFWILAVAFWRLVNDASQYDL